MMTFDQMRETATTILGANLAAEASGHRTTAYVAMCREFAREFLELEAVVRRVPVVNSPNPQPDLFKLFFGGIPGVAGASVGSDPRKEVTMDNVTKGPAVSAERAEDAAYIADSLVALRARLEEVERRFVAMKP